MYLAAINMHNVCSGLGIGVLLVVCAYAMVTDFFDT